MSIAQTISFDEDIKLWQLERHWADPLPPASRRPEWTGEARVSGNRPLNLITPPTSGSPFEARLFIGELEVNQSADFVVATTRAQPITFSFAMDRNDILIEPMQSVVFGASSSGWFTVMESAPVFEGMSRDEAKEFVPELWDIQLDN